METKICCSCRTERPISDFQKNQNTCKICKREYDLRWYQNNKNKILENAKKYYENNKARISNRNKSYREKNREKINKHNRSARQAKRDKILSVYGAICVCCGENRKEFLAVDHIGGNGNKHRKEIGRGGETFYDWIIKNNFPKMFRILCHNCNVSRGAYGYCPHEKEK